MTDLDCQDLTIAYSSLAARAADIVFPDISGVEFLVCVQGGPIPRLGLGVPFSLIEVEGFGVARSRNAALANASRRYLLFCDDDVRVDVEGVTAGVEHLRNTGKALALGRGVDPTGTLRKRYPSRVTGLNLFNSAKAATYEMLVDVPQVTERGITFDERFGAGAEFHLGDEYIFISDLLRAGLSADAVPFIYGTHPISSSGSQWGSPLESRARAAALNRVFGRWSPIGRLAFGLKNSRRFGGLDALGRFLFDRSTAQ